MNFLLVLFLPYCLLTENIRTMAVVFSILLILDILLNYSKHRKVSYLDVWNMGFLFMVTSEMILSSQLLYLQDNGLTAVRFIFVANVLFIMGFRIVSFFTNVSHYRAQKSVQQGVVVANKRIMWVLLLLALIYFVNTIQSALTVFSLGRHNFLEDTVSGEISILGKILIGISYFAPITAAFYCRYYLQYKQKFLLALIILLCTIPQFLFGTRYLLLFSLVAPLIVLFDRKRISPKQIFGGLAIIFSIISLSSLIRENRNGLTKSTQIVNRPFIEQVASLGSNENVVKRADQLFRYTESYGLHYGKESAFILYFWIPRSIWPEKPTKIGHWLTNRYENVSNKFSAAYGFWGQFFIDFGYFSLIIFFFLGMLLGRLEKLKDIHLSKLSNNSILYIALFPSIFFFIRSPQTAIINFILVLATYLLLFFLFKKLGIINKKKQFYKKFNLTQDVIN